MVFVIHDCSARVFVQLKYSHQYFIFKYFYESRPFENYSNDFSNTFFLNNILNTCTYIIQTRIMCRYYYHVKRERKTKPIHTVLFENTVIIKY